MQDQIIIDDPRQQLIVALDVSSAAAARKIVAALGDSASTYKIGMQLYTAVVGNRRATGSGHMPKIACCEASPWIGQGPRLPCAGERKNENCNQGSRTVE
jgi:hypothetical protein